MPRLTPVLLCALAVTAWTAPAPLPRPWATGWYKPVDPRGDCKFERDGDRLTITVPGEGHGLDVARVRLNAPRLLRDVEGDFVAVVRVAGVSQPPAEAGEGRVRGAGLLLTGGKAVVLVEHVGIRAFRFDPFHFLVCIRRLGERDYSNVRYDMGPPLGRPAYLRLERQGHVLRAACGEDGKRWAWVDDPPKVKLPRKLKVGVFAESTAAGEFKPSFDRFKLSRRGK